MKLFTRIKASPPPPPVQKASLPKAPYDAFEVTPEDVFKQNFLTFEPDPNTTFKNNMAIGVWSAKIAAVEKDVYSDSMKVHFNILKGPHKGTSQTYSVGDTITINYAIHID